MRRLPMMLLSPTPTRGPRAGRLDGRRTRPRGHQGGGRPADGPRAGRCQRQISLGAALLALLVGAGPDRVAAQGAPQDGDAEADAPRAGFEATGAAALSGDVVRGRERALADAMQRALEQAVLQAAPEARGRLYVVSGRARQYVTSFRVLSEGESAGQFQVRISAQVDVPRLLRDLQPGARGDAGPRRAAGRRGLLVCTAQADAARASPGAAAVAGAALSALREELAGAAAPAPTSACPEAAAEGEWPRALSRAGAAAAVLLLETRAVEAPVPLRGTLPQQFGAALRVTLALISERGDRAQEGAEAFGFGDSVETAQQAAARQAAQRAAAALLPKLRSLSPGAAGPEGTALLLTLEGVPSYGAYQALLRTVAALPGVQSVEPQRFSPREGQVGLAVGLAAPDAAGAGGPAGLGALLARTPLSGLRVQVMPPEGNRLRVLVAPEHALPAAPPPPSTPPAAPPGDTP